MFGKFAIYMIILKTKSNIDKVLTPTNTKGLNSLGEIFNHKV
jgi:hypothetical protein